MRVQVRPTLALVRRMLDQLDGAGRADAELVLDSESQLLAIMGAISLFKKLNDRPEPPVLAA